MNTLNKFIKLAALMMGLLVTISQPVYGYEIKSGISVSCHETMTMEALRIFLDSNSVHGLDSLEIPDNYRWEKYGDEFFRDLLKPFTDKKEKFVAVSLLMGVRWPDEHGISVTSAEALYSTHGDPKDQFEHCLRSKEDDFDEGSRQALKRTRDFFETRTDKAATYLFWAPDEQIVRVSEYVEFYGAVPFDLFAPAYYLGTALHTLQDSFSHTVRTDDLRSVYSVLNFVEAISSDFDEHRDGIAHSYHMDECEKDGDNRKILDAARDATLELLPILSSGSLSDAMEVTATVSDGWLRYENGCGYDNNYCDSQWLDVIRQDATGPFLGCSFSGYKQSGFSLINAVVILISGMI